jgi:heme-degrading monooxygenase HmoA
MAVIHIVGTRCQAEVEERFNKWYDEAHIPMLLKFKGLKKATRFKILKPREDYPEYVAIYEFESRQAFEDYEKSPELSAAMAEMKETWKDGGWEMVWRVQYEQI